MVQLNFNAAQYDPASGGVDIFEDGEYAFHITESKSQPTKKGDGTMLVFTCRCLEPGFEGKTYLMRLNVQNPNPQAVEIAFAELSALCHVTGVMNLTDTQQLHGRPFRLRISKAPRTDDPTKFTNDTKAILDAAGNSPVRGQPSGAAGGGAGMAPAQPPQPPQPTAPAPQMQAPDPNGAPQAPAPTQPAPAPATTPPPAAPAQPATGAPPAPNSAPAAPWQQQGAAAPAAPAAGGTPPWQQ